MRYVPQCAPAAPAPVSSCTRPRIHTCLCTHSTAHSVGARNGHGLTPLAACVASNDVQTAALLLERGALIDTRDSRGRTPLITASASLSARRGTLRWLLSNGASVTAAGDDGTTALAAAAASDRRDAVALCKALMAQGAQATLDGVPGAKALPPLAAAAGAGRLPVVEALLQAGASVDLVWACPDTGRTTTALVEAVRSGHVGVVRALLAAGASAHAQVVWDGNQQDRDARPDDAGSSNDAAPRPHHATVTVRSAADVARDQRSFDMLKLLVSNPAPQAGE